MKNWRPILIAALTGVALGVVGNFVYEVLKNLFTGNSIPASFNLPSWLVIGFSGFVIGLVLYVWWYYRSKIKIFNIQEDILAGLIELDQTLLTLIESFDRNTITSGYNQSDLNPLDKLFDVLFVNIQKVFNNDFLRGSILIPDEEGEFLKVVAQHEMSELSLKPNRFYIGDKRRLPTGIAGQTYLDGIPRVVRFTHENGISKPDVQNLYISDPERPRVAYNTLVCIPIKEGNQDPIGVMCLDSQNREAFQSKVILDYLQTVGERMFIFLELSNQNIDT